MKKAQLAVKKYLEERKWDKNDPADIAKSIIIESAELLELFQWKTFSRKQIQKDQVILEQLKGELADICIYSLGMAISLDLDIEKVILDKLAKIKAKYPVKEIRKGHTQYLKIKKEHRRNHA